MAYAIVSIVALLVACLSFFCGFGLGTLLMPALALFFPVELAIAATAVVHLANNLFKLTLVGRWAHWPTVWRYGIPAAIASIAGAFVLLRLGHVPPLRTYALAGHACAITWIGLVVALVIAGFAVLELWPGFDELSFPPRLLTLGGVLSGFFGGLSGHQGALRSAFLLRAGLTKEQLVGTRIAGAVIVDVPRVIVYGAGFAAADLARLRDGGGLGLVIAATLCAFVGSFVGSRLIKSVTLRGLKRIVGAALLLFAIALGSGVI